MTSWYPHGVPPVPSSDQVTISRPLAPQEAEQAAVSLRRAALWPLLPILLGGGGVLLLVFVGILTSWSVGWLVGAAVLWLFAVGVALAIGLPLGMSLAKARARRELGRSGLLTVTWWSGGMRLVGENVARSAAYTDIRRVRHVNGFVVLRLRIDSLVMPYMVSLPRDFVPPAAMQQIAAAGAKIH